MVAEPHRPTRERILDEAERLIGAQGMEGLRLVDLAQAVGIRPPSLFAHFGGREAIGDAVAGRMVERIASLFEAILADAAASEPERLIRRGVRAFAAHLYDHPSHVRMLLRDLARVRDDGELNLSSPVFNALAERIDAVLARGVEQGSFRQIPAAAFMASVEGAILGAIAWSGFGEGGEPLTPRTRDQILDEAEQLAVAYLCRGMSATGRCPGR